MELIRYTHIYKSQIVHMVKALFNYHRQLTRSRKEFYMTDQEALETLTAWLDEGEVLMIQEEEIIGIIYVRYGGQKAAWLEDLFIEETYRGKGFGKQAMKLLDDHMEAQGILAMFVNVIPRNERALEMYVDCGFDHLNMIELRKNYDKTLNKSEPVTLLGHELIKY